MSWLDASVPASYIVIMIRGERRFGLGNKVTVIGVGVLAG